MRRSWLLRVLALLVRPDRRQEWVREWSAELEYAARRRASRTRLLWWSIQDALSAAAWRTLQGPGLVQHLRQTLRGLRRSPAYALAVASTLALGVGVTTTMFSVVDALLIRPLPIPDPEQVVMLMKSRDGLTNATSAPNYLAWRERSGSFSQMAAAQVWSANLLAGDVPLRVRRTLVTPSFFDVLGIQPTLGRSFSEEEGTLGSEDVVILSHDLWVQAFGADSSALGTTVDVNDVSTTIVGVLPPDVRVPPLTAQLWMPLVFAPDALAAWGRNNLWVVGRLDAPLDAAKAELAVLAARLATEQPDANEGWSIDVIPLREAAVGSNPRELLLLFGAAGLVLLIACVNAAGLVLVRGLARERELRCASPWDPPDLA